MERINDAQRAMAERIVAYGRKNGIKQHLIDATVKFAYIESKLGAVESKNNNADGLFQYKPVPWKERHQQSLGSDRWSASNQIAAMFKDLQAFEARYINPSNTGIPRHAVTLEEYLYIKHHDGPNSEAFAPGLNHKREPNGLMVYRRDNPTYDATAIFGPKTSIAPIRNPWEITFGLPGGWMESGAGLPVTLTFPPHGPSVTAYGPLTPVAEPFRPFQSSPWPVVDDPWSTSEGRLDPERRRYVDSHHYDPETGASVSTRRRLKRSVAEMTEAMASLSPRQGAGAGVSDPWTSPALPHPMLAAQA